MPKAAANGNQGETTALRNTRGVFARAAFPLAMRMRKHAKQANAAAVL
jgi:hypothetical protein